WVAMAGIRQFDLTEPLSNHRTQLLACGPVGAAIVEGAYKFKDRVRKVTLTPYGVIATLGGGDTWDPAFQTRFKKAVEDAARKAVRIPGDEPKGLGPKVKPGAPPRLPDPPGRWALRHA